MICLLGFHLQIMTLFCHRAIIYMYFFCRWGSDCSGERIISKLGMSVLIESFSAVINFIFCSRSCITLFELPSDS